MPTLFILGNYKYDLARSSIDFTGIAKNSNVKERVTLN